MTNIEIIRAACIKANLSAERDWFFSPTIRLADVLLAIDANDISRNNFCMTASGSFATLGFGGRFYFGHADWNLRKDSLEEQSEKTLQFLAELLK